MSLKALVKNDIGQVLVVKESGRTWWDLPGGGMDHDEDLHAAIRRELEEEVGLQGDFDYRIIAVDSPAYLEHANVWQIRLIFEVTPESMNFTAGDDADQITFLYPESLKDSEHAAERSIYEYPK